MLPKTFLEQLCEKHSKPNTFPATTVVKELFTDIMLAMFPEQTQKHFGCIDELQEAFDQIELRLTRMLRSMQQHLQSPPRQIASEYIQQLPKIYRILLTDVQAIMAGDPAAQSEYEVIRAYPGFYAIILYRLANALLKLDVPIVPRILTEYAHSKTGIDIHPAAEIDEYFMIDHGTGVVIGETTYIGKNVKIYQGVTLGALSVSKTMASMKRHPTIEDNVVIYSGATILGGETVVGANSVIGGNVWLTRSVPENTKIYHQEQVKILQ